MMNLALFMIFKSSKASRVIKIDMVNPIPPKNPTPRIYFQFKSSGSLHNPMLTAKNVKRKIPIGFPKIKPRNIPKL